MKKLGILSFCFSIITITNAQTLLPSVVSAAGGDFTTSSGSLEWTLGEVMTETYEQSEGSFAQGFQQAVLVYVTMVEEHDEKSFFVYPNPVKNTLYVKTTQRGDYLIELFDVQGQKVISDELSNTQSSSIHSIDMKNLGPSIYLIHIVNITTRKSTRCKIEKY